MEQNEEGRLQAGVPGLDTVLNGGLIRGSVYIVQGSPGAGKTILANQVCFHHVRQGGKALYVTLLAESHDRLLSHLGRLDFFDSSKVPSSIYFISGFDTLSRDGLQGILQLLRSESRDRGASLIVLDGLFALEETAQSAKEFRKFINDLTTLSTLIGCTVLLLTNNTRRNVESVEYTMVDGWVELEMQQTSYRSERFLRVLKYRGSGFIEGRHTVIISNEGMRIYPRLEALAPNQLQQPSSDERLKLGVAELDDMLYGGLPVASISLVHGPSGVGKTTLGLHFLAGSSAREPGLMFNFYEAEEQIRAKSAALRLGLEPLLDAGQLSIVRHAPTEQRLDVLAHDLLMRVREQGIKRLLIDGIDGFAQSAIDIERLPRFMAALSSSLREEGVSVIYTLEQPQLVYAEGVIPFAVSTIAQNILLMRYVGLGPELRRALAVLKVRESDIDQRIREFEVTSQGIQIGKSVPSDAFLRGGPNIGNN